MSDLIYLKGTPKELKPIIMQIMGLYQLLESKDLGTFYVDDNSSPPPVKRRGRPKICLYFEQDTDFKATGTRSTKAHGRRRRRGTISFRLMNETPATFSQGNQRSIAQKIKDVFGANGGYIWNKGKDLYAYTDWDLGYQLELLCKSQTEARRITTSILSIQGHTPDWKKLTHSEAVMQEAKYPILPAKKIIAGKEVQPMEERPVVDVRFRYAYAIVDGLVEPINLYDRTTKLTNTAVV